MIVHNAYVYIQIGLCIRLLRQLGENSESEIAKNTIEVLKKNLLKVDFAVSLAAMRSDSYDRISKDLASLANTAEPPEELANRIQDWFATFENTVFAEALTKKVHILPSRRFNTEFLLSEPKKLLKEGVFDKLDPIAKSDFISSCRCILFGESTAAAFHILRATESVLKSYYFHHRKQKRLKVPMWGPMVEQLKTKSRNKPPAALLTSLDLIRSAYRNPTQHPEAIYEIDGAQDLFGVCIDAIGKMANELSAA